MVFPNLMKHYIGLLNGLCRVLFISFIRPYCFMILPIIILADFGKSSNSSIALRIWSVSTTLLSKMS